MHRQNCFGFFICGRWFILFFLSFLSLKLRECELYVKAARVGVSSVNVARLAFPFGTIGTYREMVTDDHQVMQTIKWEIQVVMKKRGKVEWRKTKETKNWPRWRAQMRQSIGEMATTRINHFVGDEKENKEKEADDLCWPVVMPLLKMVLKVLADVSKLFLERPKMKEGCKAASLSSPDGSVCKSTQIVRDERSFYLGRDDFFFFRLKKQQHLNKRDR